jgi:hypothetical protein
MDRSRTRLGFAVVALVALAAALLACTLSDPFGLRRPTQAPPTVAATSVTAPATAAATEVATSLSPSPPPSATLKPSATPPPTLTEDPAAEPARDPCGLPGLQVRANYRSAAGTNALLANFSGDVQILQTPGGPNIFSMQQASVQRKFVIILKNLSPAYYALSQIYMSYTEKKDANDRNPRVWRATVGFLQVLACPGGGLALQTADTAESVLFQVGAAVLFQPLAGKNTATGDIMIGLGGKIQ